MNRIVQILAGVICGLLVMEWGGFCTKTRRCPIMDRLAKANYSVPACALPLSQC